VIARRQGNGVHEQARHRHDLHAPANWTNCVRGSDECKPWTFGIDALMNNLPQRKLLGAVDQNFADNAVQLRGAEVRFIFPLFSVNGMAQ
jgi:hypothetical protein